MILCPFPWKGDARRAGGWPKTKESEANLRRYAPPPSRGRRENAAFPASSFRAEARNLFRSRSGKSCEGAGNGKHRMLHVTGDHGASCRWIYEGKQQTANEKDPSAALGMTKRGNASRPFLFNPEQKPISAPSGHLLPEEGGRSGENYLLPSRGRGMPEGQGVGRRRKRAKPTSGATRHLLPEEGERMPPFLHRHFERKREIFFVRGQAKVVRERGTGNTVCFM